MTYVCMTAWKRPDYLRRSLDALKLCRGVEDVVLLPHIEPGCDEVRSIIESIDFCLCIPKFNSERLGSSLNAASALRDGFSRGDFVVFIEEDVTLSVDALEFYVWGRDRYRDDRSVSTLTAYNRQYAPVEAVDHHRVKCRPWFHGVTFAIWCDRFALIDQYLTVQHGWDGLILRQLVEVHGMREVYPVLGRADHIGLVTSCQTDPKYDEKWMKENAVSPFWAGNTEVADGVWSEVI